MELLALGLLAALAALFAAGMTTALYATGSTHMTRRGVQIGRGMWLGALALMVAGGLLLFGLPALLAAWPFWLLFLAASAAFFAFQEWSVRRAAPPAAPAPLAATAAPPITWDSLWRSYEGRPLPPWMLQQALSGQVVYDGRPATVRDGVLLPRPAASPYSLDAAFDRLDRLLGG